MCTDGICVEITTKCKNNICGTAKKHFKSENYKPEPLKIKEIPIEISNQFFNFTQIQESLEVMKPSTIYGNVDTGLIDVIINSEKSFMYWSNLKHVTRTCQNKICEVITEMESCFNGQCSNIKEKEITEIDYYE